MQSTETSNETAPIEETPTAESPEGASKPLALPKRPMFSKPPATAASRSGIASVQKINWTEELTRLKELPVTDARSQCFRALVYGASGTGKSTSLRTAKRPLLIHSFDPGGSKGLSDLIASSEAFVDTAFEHEDPMRPSAFKAWDSKFTAMRNSDIFEQVGTFVIDSATTWAQCALYEILSRAKRTGQTPQQNDWYPQMNLLELAIRQMLTLPCDVILLAHDTADKDDVTGRITRGPLFTGKLTVRIPILFDELYYSHVKQTAKGPEYLWQTAADATNSAKSRLASMASRRGQVIEQYVPQDFKELLKKSGLPHEDKKVVL